MQPARKNGPEYVEICIFWVMTEHPEDETILILLLVVYRAGKIAFTSFHDILSVPALREGTTTNRIEKRGP